MKIWVDFINSPQVSFFEPLLQELSVQGHEFVLTCRDSANTVELIKQKQWKFTVIGNKAQKGTLKKLLAFPSRIFALYGFLKNKAVDVAICQSSFYLPLTSTLLRIPSIYTNDNEHALGNIPAFMFATRIFIPESLPLRKVITRGAQRRKVIQYPGIKEGVYLWPKGQDIQSKRQNVLVKNKVYIRPEPLTAQYYSGKLNFLDDFIVELKAKYSVTVLVRDNSQLEHYSQPKFSGVSVPAKPVSFDEVAIGCLMFIGAGGSMTREMAMMGVPTISVYQGKLLEVDKFLIQEGLMVHQVSLSMNEFEVCIKSCRNSKVDSNLIVKGKEAYELFKKYLLAFND